MGTGRVYMMNGKGLVHTKYSSSGGMIVGGAVPLLLKTPSVIQGEGLGANQIVGIMSPAPPRSAVTGTTQAVKKPLVFQGGELLNKIAFEPYLPKGKRDNIKFLF